MMGKECTIVSREAMGIMLEISRKQKNASEIFGWLLNEMDENNKILITKSSLNLMDFSPNGSVSLILKEFEKANLLKLIEGGKIIEIKMNEEYFYPGYAEN